MTLNSLPTVKIIDTSKLKALAVDTLKMAKMMEFVSDRAENIVGKRENVDYQHFLFSHNVFQRLYRKVVKSRDCVVKCKEEAISFNFVCVKRIVYIMVQSA